MSGLRATTAEYAALALSVVAAAGPHLSGVWLRSQAGPARQRWLEILHEMAGSRAWQRVPASADEDRLLGGLDLGATLNSGRPVLMKGLLAESNGGFLELRMAERQSPAAISAICATLDSESLRLERDGFSREFTVRCCVVACDEARGDDDPLDSRLADRLGVVVNLDSLSARAIGSALFPVSPDEAALLWQAVAVDEVAISEWQRIAEALAIRSPRAVLAAMTVARVLAALHGRDTLDDQDVIDAAALCLIARVPGALEQLQTPPQEAESPPEAKDSPPDEAPSDGEDSNTDSGGRRPDEVAAAAAAVLPDQLLAGLVSEQSRTARQKAGGNAASNMEGGVRGKPMPSRSGMPTGGKRLDVLATLKTAAPWQRVRGGEPGRLRIVKSDLRVRKFTEQTRTTTIFVVDASGSAAVQRLGETKGAIELLLAECYVRRDQVALVAFRGSQAELLLPATRSLVRAKRALSALPGGGGTPLASGLRLATQVADGALKRGETPVLVLLSDGRGNITLDGDPDPALATEQALAVANEIAARGYTTLSIDTGRRGSARGRKLADAMGARYLALPFADATQVTDAVREVAA
ncbi:MAG: magnesium chelatase subunit D [Pseudomonadota bacterium]